jgi:hypothetical protein
MKIVIFFTALLVTLSSCQSGDDTQAKKEELQKIITDYFNALSKKDTIALRSLTTSNFVLFDEGVVYNNQTAVKAMAERKPFKVSFVFDSVNVHMDKKDASVYYFRKADYVLDDTAHMSAKFLESATFNKEDGKWKLRFLHSTFRGN